MVQGFERAQQEYERHMECPYDEGGALYDEDWEREQYMDYLETQAEYAMERQFCIGD